MSGRRRQIAGTFARHLVGGFARQPGALFSGGTRRRVAAQSLRRALEELGPTFIKLGQLASVRPDLVSAEVLEVFAGLRDSVAPLPFEQMRPVVEAAVGPLEAAFASFDPEPIASASVAQVYRATLRDPFRTVSGDLLPTGAAVAVKVVRPGSRETLMRDLDVFTPFAARLAQLKPLGRLLGSGLVDELAASLEREFDLRIEGRTAERFAFDFRDDPVVTAPRTIWPLTSADVLTMEFMEGWTLEHVAEANAAGIDTAALSAHGSIVFMRQVLSLGRFHADLHPANLIITTDGRIAYIDFGIAGTLDESQRAAVAQVLLATVYRDADRAIRYSRELGLAIPHDREDEIRARVDALMRATLSPPGDITAFALGFLRLLGEYEVSVPQGYGLLVKGLITVEGCARLLNPGIDLMTEAAPYVTELVAERLLDPAAIWANLPRAVNAAIRELLR